MKGTKVCSKCKKEKNLSEFYTRKERKSGYYPSCKACKNKVIDFYKNTEQGKKKIREGRIKYSKKNIIKKRIIGRRSYKKNRDKILPKKKIYRFNNREKIKISHEKFRKSKNGIKYYKKYRIRYRKENCEKVRANRILQYNVLKGKIIRPKVCSICGTDKGGIEGHHEDYSKPLDVIWSCNPCHKVLDKKRRERENINKKKKYGRKKKN